MNHLIHPKEQIYFILSLIVSILLYILGILIIILYGPMIALMLLFVHGMLIGNLKGNGVKISDRQFPEIHQSAQRLSKKLGMNNLPDIYLLQSGGALNAFATNFLGKNFVVLYSDVMELAYEEGQEAVDFILCHELVHLQRKHISKNLLLLPSQIIPFLGTAYSRACEYTCDAIASHLVPNGAMSGLLVLAGGKKLHKRMNISAFTAQASEDSGFWTWFAEINSSHPFLSKRVRRINELVPAPSSFSYEESANISL